MNWRDRIYMTRKRAIALGATHEGYHCGVAHWAWYDESAPDNMAALPKLGLLEPWVTLCLLAHGFINSLREPGEQADFSFVLRPIGELQA